jgi:hypothetical protein
LVTCLGFQEIMRTRMLYYAPDQTTPGGWRLYDNPLASRLSYLGAQVGYRFAL